MAKYRSERLGEELAARVSEIIATLKDPRIPQIVSVTRAEVTPDLKLAKVFISALGDEEVLARCVKGLQSSAGYVRHELSQRMELRQTPELKFIADTGLIKGQRVIDLLKGLESEGEGKKPQ